MCEPSSICLNLPNDIIREILASAGNPRLLTEYTKAYSRHVAQVISVLEVVDCDNIDSDGVRALADALKTNATVHTLDLSNNTIGVEGARALERVLAARKRL